MLGACGLRSTSFELTRKASKLPIPVQRLAPAAEPREEDTLRRLQ